MLNLTLAIFLCFQSFFTSKTVTAVSAYPYPVEFKQPDGSKITILLKGDEKVKWAETLDGYIILFNQEGTYEYAVLNSEKQLIPSGIQANNKALRTIAENNFLLNIPKFLQYSAEQIQMMSSVWNVYQSESQNAFPTTGNRSLVCILIGFTDLAFTKTQTDFNNLFNQINYSVGGATGSVKDYYLENSYNQLNLTVTVAGPYTASNTMAYYGANDVNGDVRPRELIAEAVNLANPAVNYANFDNDNNGSVDGVYVIYAGYGEEAGGGANTIWAHAWSLASTLTLDGKTISKYSCSAELSGNSGVNISNIGVICHEFGHVLGAPDFYDTDYSTGGQFSGTGNWDMMASGSWNNGGKTPAHHNAYTKTMVYNWASYTNLSSASQITLNNAAENLNSFYRYNTATSNEYFLIENRQQVKFDAYIPGHGMIIYHVHSLIGTSGINTTHPQKMYPVCASATTNPSSSPSDYGIINSGGCPFPGSSAKTSFTDATTPWAKSWALVNTAKPITSITENNTNKTVSFNFMGGVSCTVPTAQANSFSASALSNNSMTVGWTRGTGNSVLVVARQGSAINESPANGTAYTANSVLGSGTQIGSGNYVVYNGTGSSVNISALTQGTTYHFAIYEYTSSSFCYLLPALSGNATTTGTAPSYCSCAGNTTYQTSITSVSFNSINNTSAKPAGYNNYTPLITTVYKKSSHNLSVNLNTDGNYAVRCIAWIDWNQDGDFLDAGEEFDLGSTSNSTDGTTSFSPLSISIPETASSGNTRMRVAARFNSYPTSCLTSFDGEVEDYTINIPVSALPIELLYFNASSLDGKVVLSWKTASETNNDYFLVEKSMNSFAFNSVGMVKGSGNTSELKSYSFYDLNPTKGTSFYRLKQVDFDGKYEYSSICKVSISDDLDDSVLVYPNPVEKDKNFKILFFGKKPENVIISIIDVTGKVRKSMTFNNESKIDFYFNETGVFILHIVEENKIITKQIIIK